MGGVIADRKGRVRGLWASFVDLSGEDPDAWFAGIPTRHLLDSIAHLDSGAESWPTVGAELVPVPLSVAGDLGLDEATMAALEAIDSERVVLGVSLAAGVLRKQSSRRAISSFAWTEGSSRARGRRTGRAAGSASLDVLRRGKIEAVRAEPWMLDSTGTRRAVGLPGLSCASPMPQWPSSGAFRRGCLCRLVLVRLACWQVRPPAHASDRRGGWRADS